MLGVRGSLKASQSEATLPGQKVDPEETSELHKDPEIDGG